MSSFVSASCILPLPRKIPVSPTHPPSLHLLILVLWSLPSEQGRSVQGCVLSGNLISEFVTSEGGRGDSERGKQRESLKEGRWIDGWRGDSQRDDRKWIKGEIERDCRHRAVWHRQTVLFCCLWAAQIALCVTPTMLWSKYTAISQHRQASCTRKNSQTLAL